MEPVNAVPHRRPGWRKLRLAADESTNEIRAVELTTHSISDAEMVKPLAEAVAWPIAKLSGDGAYDQVKVHDELETRPVQPVVPPRSDAVIWTDAVAKQRRLCFVGKRLLGGVCGFYY